jgi:hypothetical protein
MITEIIEALHKFDYFGAGEFTEIAKGKFEIPTTVKGGIYKVKRKWLSKRK